MIQTFFNGLDELYHDAKFGEDLQHEPAVGGKTVFVTVFFCHAARPERCSLEGDIVQTSIV